MASLIEVLHGTEALRFEDLFKEDYTKPRLVVTFVALLELIRLGIAKAYQEQEFGTLWIIRAEEKPIAEVPQGPAEVESA
jgi:segregation and condensation protein A